MLNQTRTSQNAYCSSKSIIHLLLQFTTFILNSAAVLALWRLKDHRSNISHLVVRILVISDVFGSISTIIPVLISCSGRMIIDETICNVFGYLSSVFLLWTALIILLLCFLRYLALIRPLFYRTYLTCRIVQYALLGELIWSLSHLLLPLVGIGRFKFYPEGQYCAFEIKPSNSSDTVLVHITVWEGWLTISILLFFTVRMVQELRVKKKHASRLSFQQRRGVRAGGQRQQGYTLMTVIIVLIFMVCYVPFLMYRMIALITRHVDEDYHYILHLLANLNPLLNPIIYIAFNKSYRQSLRRLFRGVICCYSPPLPRSSKLGSISMVLFSTSSDEANHNPVERQRSGSLFLTVPSFQTRAVTPASDGVRTSERGQPSSSNVEDLATSSFSDVTPQEKKRRHQKSFSEQLTRKKKIVNVQINKSFHSSHLSLPPPSPRGKRRGVSISSIAALVVPHDDSKDDSDDDVFLPGSTRPLNSET